MGVVKTVIASKENQIALSNEAEANGYEAPASIFGFKAGKYTFLTSDEAEFLGIKLIERNSDNKKLSIHIVAGTMIDEAGKETECTLKDDSTGKTQQLSIRKPVWLNVMPGQRYKLTIDANGYVKTWANDDTLEVEIEPTAEEIAAAMKLAKANKAKQPA